MVVLGQNLLASRFIEAQGGGWTLPETTQSFIWVDQATRLPTAAIQIFRVSSNNAWASFACTSGRFPRGLLEAVGRYAFLQLRLKRLTYEIAASNLKSIKFVESLGAYREATLPDGCSDGDMHIYCLRPDRCPIWRKLYGRRRKCTTSS
jgi:hypothetical protein